jgi:hypothetical protein
MTLNGQTYLIYQPDIWCPKVDMLFRARLTAAKFFTDYSDYLTEGGRSLVIPHSGQYTAGSITTTTGEIEANIVIDTGTRLDLNLWYGVARVFADFQKVQVASNYRIKEVFADEMAFALAKQLDTSIMELITSSYPSRVVNASTAGIKSSDLESALGIVESYGIPREECAFFFTPKAYFNEVLAVQKLYDASQFGKGAPVAVGSHDQIYGVPVYVTSQLPTTVLAEIAPTTTGRGHRCLLIHKRAIGYALGNLPMTGNAYAMPSGVRLQEKEAEALRTSVIADIMYGVKTIGGSYRGVRIICKVND